MTPATNAIRACRGRSSTCNPHEQNCQSALLYQSLFPLADLLAAFFIRSSFSFVRAPRADYAEIIAPLRVNDNEQFPPVRLAEDDAFRWLRDFGFDPLSFAVSNLNYGSTLAAVVTPLGPEISGEGHQSG